MSGTSLASSAVSAVPAGDSGSISTSPAPAGAPLAQSGPVSRLSSPELFRSCASGTCDLSWREFVVRFHSRLVVAVRRSLLRLGAPGTDNERVEDLVQEIYFRLLGGGGRPRQFRGSCEAQLMTYLQRVATSVVVDARRATLAQKRTGGRAILLEEWRLAPLAGFVEIAEPEDRLLAGERRRAFLEICRQALGAHATRATMRIARLALLEGWTSREIAAGLDGRLGIAGVDSIIYRLRRKLSRRGIDLPRRDRLDDTRATPLEASREAERRSGGLSRAARPRSRSAAAGGSGVADRPNT